MAYRTRRHNASPYWSRSPRLSKQGLTGAGEKVSGTESKTTEDRTGVQHSLEVDAHALERLSAAFRVATSGLL